MDAFPEDFNLERCVEIISTNQTDLIKSVRETFYKTAMSATESCEKSVELKFPEKLWPENKVDITKELLDRFGDISVYTDCGQHDVTRIIVKKEDIPREVSAVIIEFWK